MQDPQRCYQLALQTFLNGFPSGTLARDGRLDDDVHLLRECGVVLTLHTTVFSVLMEEAGTLARANEDATKLTHIARDMNHVLARQKAEKRLLLIEEAQKMIGSKSALEAICTLSGGEGNLSGATVERPTVRFGRRSA